MRETEHFYFTKKGRRQSMCKDCHKAYYAARKDDPQKVKEDAERHARYYQKHKAWHRNYYIERLKDPIEHEKQLQRQRDWKERNKGHVSERAREWYEKNKDRIGQRRRVYDKVQWATNPLVRERKNNQKKESLERRKDDPQFIRKRKGWARVHNHTRRIRLKGSKVGVDVMTDAQWQQICKDANYRCLCCGKKKKLCVDHVLPISKGGTHTKDNVQPLCISCNAKKHSKTTDYRK